MRKKNNRNPSNSIVKQEPQEEYDEFIMEDSAIIKSDSEEFASLRNDDPKTSVSDASTELNESDVDESENCPTDDPFTYLQNLNSDNLMKFSQQSALQQLIEEQMDTKPNLKLIPMFEEHDMGGHNFRISIDYDKPSPNRTSFVYSRKTSRLYIKPKQKFYVDCFYTPKMPIQPLHVRVFTVFDKETSDPVLRCQNHISQDPETNELVKKSFIRCENPDANYLGSDTGKTINERHSVIVPLKSACKVMGSMELKQQLILSFACNNSCMGRRPLSTIFILEGMNGEILAQRTLSIKVSTCPKRDKRLTEEPSKRRITDEPNFCAVEPKIAKYDDNSTQQREDFSRSSFEEPSDDESNSIQTCGDNGVVTQVDRDVNVHHERETGDFVLTLKYRSRKHLLQALRVLYSNAVTNEVFYSPDNNNGQKKKTGETENLRRGYERALRLKALLPYSK